MIRTDASRWPAYYGAARPAGPAPRIVMSTTPSLTKLMLDAVAGFEVRVAPPRLASLRPDRRFEPPAATVGDEAQDVTGGADRIVGKAVQDDRDGGRTAALRGSLGLRRRERDLLPVGTYVLECQLSRGCRPRPILQVLVERR